MATWHCGAFKCPTHPRPGDVCQAGTWMCRRLTPGCPAHTSRDARCEAVSGSTWSCGSEKCPGHTQWDERCALGKWTCGRWTPRCGGHPNPFHRCLDVPLRIFLTFDDGPNAGTSDVLDALRGEGVTATFFLTGLAMEKKPAEQYKLLKIMLKDGHVLANHGYDHDPMTKKGYKATTPAEVKKDFEGNVTKLDALFTGQGDTFPPLKVARLPGDGRFMPSYVDMIVKQLKIPHAGWDFEFADNGRMGHIANRDWQGVTGVSATLPGLPRLDDILLLHDLHWRGKTNLLAALIKKLKTGFSFATLEPVPPGLRPVKYP
jgi:hypothetical protein